MAPLDGSIIPIVMTLVSTMATFSANSGISSANTFSEMVATAWVSENVTYMENRWRECKEVSNS